MKRFYTNVLFGFIVCSYAAAQFFTIEDIETGRYTYLKPAKTDNLQWLGKTDNIIYSRENVLYKYDPVTGKEKQLIALAKLQQLLTRNNIPEIKQFPSVTSLKNGTIYFTFNGFMIFVNPDDVSISAIKVPPGAQNITISPGGDRIAYTADHNVFVAGAGSDIIQITSDSAEGIVNGETTYRHEFGMVTGIFWSPEGTCLAYYRKDESKVAYYPLVNIEKRIAETEPVRYPMAGMDSEFTEVWVYHLADNKKVKLDVYGTQDSYHTNLSWQNEAGIFLQHLNRGQDTMVLFSYNAQTGTRGDEVLRETRKTYVEPLNPIIFSKSQPGNFLYQSDRDGFNHIYLYDAKIKSLTQLTQGNWEVVGPIALSEDEKRVFFTATRESPLELHPYIISLESGEIMKLSSDRGTHYTVPNNKGTMFIDTYSSFTVPNKSVLYDSKGNLLKMFNDAPNPIAKYRLGEVDTGTIMAADGTTPLYYKLVKPVDFDPSQKYPVIVYVYGGPHVQLISDSWYGRIDYLHQYYAQHGIASFILDCRGSDNRGKTFEEVIYRQQGIPQTHDQYEGVKFLQSLNWIDTARMGIEGWSFGGYMTLSMLVNYPGVFKVGVAGGAVTDWKYYEVMYGERYMDTPEQNPDGYRNTNLNLLTDNLQSKLMLIHGSMDDVVVWQHSLVFLQEGISKGKMIDYFIYPGEKHGVTGNNRLHLTRMISEYFFENL